MPYVSSALGSYDRLFGTDHPKTALATLTLGQALIATGDDEQGVANCCRQGEAPLLKRLPWHLAAQRVTHRAGQPVPRIVRVDIRSSQVRS